jgi:hypothetical protein
MVVSNFARPERVLGSPEFTEKHVARRSQALVAVRRFASLEPASLDAAIRDGLADLAGPENHLPPEAYVYFQNWRGRSITLDIGVPVQAHNANAGHGRVRRYPKVSVHTVYPERGAEGLSIALDRAAEDLGLQSREQLVCWQTLSLPFRGYDATAPLQVAPMSSEIDRRQNAGGKAA